MKDRESILSGFQKSNSLRWELNRPFARYAIVIIAVGAGLLLQETLNRVLGQQLPTFILLYPPVLLVAVLSGLRPGLLATLLAALGASYLFISPVGHFSISRAPDLVSLIIFLAMGILLSLLAERYRQGERQKHTMEAYRQQSEMMNASFDAIMVVRLGKGVENWNRGAERLYGYSKSEAQGRDPHELLNTAPAISWPEIITTLRQQDTWECELSQKTKDGNEVIVATRYQLFIGPDGAELILKIGRDITERKEAENHLVQMEGRYRGLLEAAPDGMVVVNEHGEIVLLNAQTERQFRYRRDELLGQKVTNIIPEGFAERLVADGTRSAAEALAQQIGTGLELNGRRKDGTEFPIEIMLSPLENDEGILVTAAIRDITERKRAEREILALNRDLERRVELRTAELSYAVRGLSESVKELESFSYSVSHDLRAPLRHMDGFLTLLYKKSYSTLDDSAKHYVDCALQASKRMGCLIDDLLKFSRLGRSEIRKMPVDLNLLVDQIQKELEPEARDRQVVWNLGVMPNVSADEGMLRQVLGNLIGNALKFTRHRPVAEIGIGSEPGANGEVVIFVRDNGAGFDTQYYNKMFQVFQRLHSEQEFEGTGIGLAIARRVVERHGGRIWAEGIVGKGANFYFALPS